MTGLPKDCPHCGESMGEVIAAEQAQRSGWYCAGCQTFIKAIGRERFLDRRHPAKTYKGDNHDK